MAYLHNFGVGNFRVFKDLYNFKFSPITVLTGTNSSGKSSLIKAILLIQSAFKSNPKLEFPFKEIDIPCDLNLGNFTTVKNQDSKDNYIHFELPFKLSDLSDEFLIKFKYFKGDSRKFGSIDKLQIHSFELIHSISSNSLYNLKIYNESYFVSQINFSLFYELLSKSSNNNVAKSYKAIDTWIDEPRLSPQKPFLTYLFLEDEDWLINNIKNLQRPFNFVNITDFILELKSVHSKLKKLAESSNLNISELILKWELSKLDSFILTEKDEKHFPLEPFSQLSFINNDSTFFETESDKIINEDNSSLCRTIFNQIFNREVDLPQLNEYTSSLSIEVIREIDDLVKPIYTYFPNKYSTHFNSFSRMIKNNYKNGMEDLKRSFLYIDYVSSVRTKVDRIYRIGTKESPLHEIIHDYLNTNFEKNSKNYLSDICKNVLKISDDLFVKANEDDATFADIYLSRNGKVKKLADYGYGLSQLIPILLKLHINVNGIIEERNQFPEYIHKECNSTIIIEEPETNLHPSLQSKLADLFVYTAKTLNVQFIIETHSEYLIRKLQYLTAKKDISPDYTKIYYFNPPEDTLKNNKLVKEIKIMKDGKLSSHFGKGFYDESAQLMIDIINLNMN